jgi:hypothetical protein
MDTVPVDVVKYMLDNVTDTNDLVAFHRLSKIYSSVVDDPYWRQRVSRLLSLPLQPADVQWNELYYHLMKAKATAYLSFLLRYQVPASVIVEWVTINHPPHIVRDLGLTSRFELIPELVTLVDPGNVDISELQPTDPRVLQLLNQLQRLNLYELFERLLRNSHCPMSILTELDDIYHFIKLAEYRAVATQGRKISYLRSLLLTLRRHGGVPLTKTEMIARIDFILERAPSFRLDSDYSERVLDMVKDVDFGILFLRLDPVHIQDLLYPIRYELHDQLAKILVRTLNPKQIHKEVQLILDVSVNDAPTAFDSQVLQHPSIDQEYLISVIMPKLFVRIQAYQRAAEGEDSDEEDVELESATSLWKKWGITNPDIFLDPRTYGYINNYQDILELLSEVPYSNDPASGYFVFLLRLEVTDDTALNDYIGDEEDQKLGEDKTLWRNLVAAGKYDLVITLLKYAARERGSKLNIKNLRTPQGILDWINSW